MSDLLVNIMEAIEDDLACVIISDCIPHPVHFCCITLDKKEVLIHRKKDGSKWWIDVSSISTFLSIPNDLVLPDFI